MIELMALGLGFSPDVLGLGMASAYLGFHVTVGRKLLKPPSNKDSV